MQPRRLLAAALPILLALASLPVPAAARSYMTGSFDTLAVVGDVTVEVTSGGAPGAEAEGSPDDLDRLRIDRMGQKLTIRMERAPLTSRRDARGPVRVALRARALRAVDVAGSSQVALDRLEGRETVATLSGSGRIGIGRVAADSLRVGASGSGSVAIAGGTVRNADVVLNGAAGLDAASLTADRLKLVVAGAGNASIAVDESARISGSGSGSIAIGGRGDCIVNAAATLAIACPAGAAVR